jgi:hypothetical protein
MAALVLVATLVGASAAGLERAEAGDCGGARPCGCGDRVVANYLLQADLGPCERGLRLHGRIRFDGGGRTIRGTGGSQTYGLVLDRSAGASEVRDVEVTGFERGIRLDGVRGALLDLVRSHHNGDPVRHVGYGIDVAGGASDNRIMNVDVHHNADEGIHVGSGADRNLISASKVHDNFRENVYFLSNRGNVLEGSELTGGGAAAVYMKHARDARLSRNTVRDRPIVVRGATSGTRIAENVLQRSRLVFQPYSDQKLGLTRPSRTTVHLGRIEGDRECIAAEGTSDLTLEGVELKCPVSLVLGGQSDVIAIATELRTVKCAGAGKLSRARNVEVRFVSSAGEPLAGAQIEVDGATGRPIATADGRGRFSGAIVTSTEVCPALQGSATGRSAGTVVVVAGKRMGKFELDALKGDVVIQGEASPAPAAAPRRRRRHQ